MRHATLLGHRRWSPRQAQKPRFFNVERLEDRQLLTGLLAEYNVGGPVYDVATGPDGNLWYFSNYDIGRISPSGQIQQVSVPSGSDVSRAITTGPDGNLWFVASQFPYSNNSTIGRITPDGHLTTVPTPTPGSQPGDITSGPDGNLWFTENATHQIGRITPSGTITEFPGPNGFDLGSVAGITAGPDGALWFTVNSGAGAIGRITTAGQITLFPLPGNAPNGIVSITAGPDGALWFTESTSAKIGRITTAGAISEFAMPNVASGSNGGPSTHAPTDITTGTDGNLWFSEYSGTIGRITPGGQITEFPIAAHPGDYQYGSGNFSIASGPDGNIWFTEPYTGRVGRFSPNDETLPRGVDARGTAGLDDHLLVASYVSHGDTSQDSATIDWGDGTSSSATLATSALSSPGSTEVTISGDHTYAQTGNFTITVVEQAGGQTTATTSTAHVVNSAEIHTQGLPAYSAVGLPNTFTYPAGFTSTDTNARADSFTATIDWGDGTTTAGIVSPAGGGFGWISPILDASSSPATSGVFAVSGNHAYASAGNYAVHITLADRAGDSASVASSVSVSSPETLTLSPNTVGGFPGQALGNVSIVSLNDSAPGLSAVDFTVTIDWGDGTTTAGTLSPLYYALPYGQLPITSRPAGRFVQSAIVDPIGYPNGSNFSVQGSHTYANSGTYSVKVTITSLSGISAQASATATVGPIVPFATANYQTIGFPPTTPSFVGGFRVPNASASSGDYTATIDWGDGTTTTGTISAGYSVVGSDGKSIVENDYSVYGSHTYTTAGTYTTRLTIADNDGHSATASATATVDNETLTPIPVLFSESATVPFGRVKVASFQGSSYQETATDFTANIDWGDGTTSTGTIQPNYLFLPPIFASTATASHAALSSDVFRYGVTFDVSGSHTYAQPGKYHVQVTITSVRGASTLVHSGVDVIPGPPETISANGTTFAAVAGQPIGSGTAYLATFHDSDSTISSTQFVAAIDWGDGSAPTLGTIGVGADAFSRSADTNASSQVILPGAPTPPQLDPGTYSVLGNHTYVHPGIYQIHMTIARVGGPFTTVASGVDVVSVPAEQITASPTSVNAAAGIRSGFVQVAHFVDNDPAASAQSFTATIDWGDHTPAAVGTISATTFHSGPGQIAIHGFAVVGSHKYAHSGRYTVHVTIHRIGGPSATAVSSALVTARRLPVSMSHPKGPAGLSHTRGLVGARAGS
jgi:streptogramin lyase